MLRRRPAVGSRLGLQGVEMTTSADKLACPDCSSNRIAVTEETMFMVNTGEHYCHSVKAHDTDAKVLCLYCRWTGQRGQLEQVNVKR